MLAGRSAKYVVWLTGDVLLTRRFASQPTRAVAIDDAGPHSTLFVWVVNTRVRCSAVQCVHNNITAPLRVWILFSPTSGVREEGAGLQLCKDCKMNFLDTVTLQKVSGDEINENCGHFINTFNYKVIILCCSSALWWGSAPLAPNAETPLN